MQILKTKRRTMNNFRKSIQEQEQLLLKAKQCITQSIGHFPKGKLKLAKQKDVYKYYYSSEEKKKRGRQSTNNTSSNSKSPTVWTYLPKSERAFAASVAQKDYYQKLLPKIEKTLDLLRQLKFIYETDSLENVYESLCQGRKDLVTPLFPSAHRIIDKWKNKKYEPGRFEEGNAGFLTLKGERVRSKSEKMIADELYIQEIFYLYEYPLTLKVNGKDVIFRPDFIVFNKRTGQKYILEHLGMMNDNDYYNNSLRKLDVFEQNNILIGRDLLIFHESKKCPLNVQVIRQYIQEYLV